MIGILDSVSIQPLTSSLDVAAETGDTVLYVDSVLDFDETGLLSLGGTQMPYTAVDEDTDSITVAAPIAADFAENTQVQALEVTGEIQQRWLALVQLDPDEGAPAIPIHTSLIPYFREGASQRGIRVEVDLEDWVVTGMPDMQPESSNTIYWEDDDKLVWDGVTDPKLALTHIPHSETLLMRQNGLVLAPDDWTLDQNIVSIAPAVRKRTDDRFAAYYGWTHGNPEDFTPSFLISDNFDRAVLGSAVTSTGTAIPWEEDGGVWVVEDNALFPSSVSDLLAVCVVQTDHADGLMEVSIVGGVGAAGRGIVFRVADDLNSGFGLEMTGRVAFDSDFDSGGDTTLTTLPEGFDIGDVIGIRMEGTTITFLKNGAELGSITSSSNQAETKHGFVRSVTGSASNGFDVFRFTELSS